MGAPYPIFFLPEMTLAAHIIHMVQIDFASLARDEKVTVILTMTGIAGKGSVFAPVIYLDISVRNISSIKDGYFLIVVAGTWSALSTFWVAILNLDATSC
jgi:hypothetical protein